jgi:hypothetical protein
MKVVFILVLVPMYHVSEYDLSTYQCTVQYYCITHSYTEVCEAWTETEASTEDEAGLGGEEMAEDADAARSLGEAAATPTTIFYDVAHILCSTVYFVK